MWTLPLLLGGTAACLEPGVGVGFGPGRDLGLDPAQRVADSGLDSADPDPDLDRGAATDLGDPAPVDGGGEPACAPRPEECNGLDDDCDGLVDEAPLLPPSGGPPGVCGAAVPTCAGSSGWQYPDPSPEALRGWEPQEQTCDGLDNDCDGQVDVLAQGSLVLVLDYSASMDSAFGDGLTRLQALRQAVDELLELGLALDLGLVVYGTDVLDTVAVSPRSAPPIRAALDQGTDNMTCTRCGLESAAALLRATPPVNRHLVLVSDGIYNAGGDPRPTAWALRQEEGVSIWAVEISHGGGGGGNAAFLRSIAGPRGTDAGAPAHYLRASSSEGLRQTMRALAARLRCR